VQALVKTILFSFAASGVAVAVAFAADLPLPTPKAKPDQTQPKAQPAEFDRLGGDCVEATNGCQRFVRAADGQFDPLNNIGIACQPQPLSCTKRR
jgi:hypothetical protein